MAAWDRFWRHGVSVNRRFGMAGGRIAWGGGFMGWVSLYGLAFDGSIGFGGMECRSFDGWVGRHKFAMGVGCFFSHGNKRCGIGEHWSGVISANLVQLE